MKKFLLSLSVVAFAVPNIVSAVWWNPASWFENKTVPITEEQKVNTDIQSEVSVKEDLKIEPVIKEKIIEKTITVDNPELQKQINSLLQENADLRVKVSSLASSLNICKATPVSKPETTSSGYSDFNFSYVLTTNKITFPFSTSRDIVIKKAVFHIRETDIGDTRKIGSIQRLEVSTSTASKPLYYNLENSGSKFTFLGTGIALKGKEIMVINVSIANSSGGKETETFYMVPDFSEWEVWDNTTDKPVRVE